MAARRQERRCRARDPACRSRPPCRRNGSWRFTYQPSERALRAVPEDPDRRTPRRDAAASSTPLTLPALLVRPTGAVPPSIGHSPGGNVERRAGRDVGREQLVRRPARPAPANSAPAAAVVQHLAAHDDRAPSDHMPVPRQAERSPVLRWEPVEAHIQRCGTSNQRSRDRSTASRRHPPTARARTYGPPVRAV